MTRADAALRQGDLDRALYEYVNVLTWDEDKVDAHYMVGVIHYLKGNLGLAMRAFQKTLSMAEHHAAEGQGARLPERGARVRGRLGVPMRQGQPQPSSRSES